MCTQIFALAGNQGMFRKCCLSVIAFVAILGLPFAGQAQTVTLAPGVTSPQMLGTSVTWTATVQNPVSGHTYGYRFSATYNGISQIVQDYSPANTFTWTPYTVEGAYKFSVTARDTTSTPYTVLPTAAVPYTLLPWVTTPMAAGVVNPTVHPLVALFSAPPCAAGDSLLVRFHPASSSVSMTTNLIPCSTTSANFYVAGMYASTQYLMHWEEYNGTNLVHTGNDLPFTTGPLPSTFPTSAFTVNVPAQASDAAYPVLLFQVAYPTATDLSGKVLWYFPNNTGLTLTNLSLPRMEPNGYFYSIPSKTLLEAYNLSGNMVLQTNLARLNEQLVAKGYPAMSQINSHEVRNLPDGNIGLLGLRDVKSTTAQGGTPAKPVTIEGDMVVVMDHNLQVVWAWDSFAHQDITRAATDGDLTAGGSNDWTHTNALQGTEDGNIIISERSQDMVLKINYAKGTGDGSVIWKLGAGLDFTVANPPTQTCNATTIPGNPNIIPWFTHQHDAHFDFEEDASGAGFTVMTVFDDGNTRNAECTGTQNSRGMVLLLDEAARQVYIQTAADLGAYSFALGSAQLMTYGDGNLTASFNSGILPGGLTQVSEVNLAGQIVYQMQTNQETYRAYRMQNLYTPTEFENNASIGAGNGVSLGVPPPNQPFDYSAGFAQDQDELQLNGSASLAGNSLELTNGGNNEAASAFFASPVNVQSFTTDFTFQLTNAVADGFTFTIQGDDPTALGSLGGSLGYQHIENSVAVKFDLYSNAGEGADSTGIYTDGVIPTTPSIDLTDSGIDLHSGDVMDAHITYDGTNLNLTITDMVTAASYSHAFPINIPATVGGSTAYVGFTGGTGGHSATQQILSWSYEAVQVPYSPAGFPSSSGLALNGSATLAGSAIELTNGGTNEAGSAFFTTPVNVQSFNTDFDFQLTNAKADGFTFTIQNAGPTALGSLGGSLGYQHITKSVAVKFDLYSNAGEGADSTGIYTDGAIPTLPGIDLTDTGINLHSGDMMHANLVYDGEALTLTITDLVTSATWSYPFTIDIPDTVGGSTAYVGFTGGSGGLTATQQILNWTFE
jgi:hypothetical protein